MPSLPQSSTIAFALIVGFIVFITVRGELQKYLGVLGLGPDAVNGPAQQSGGSGVVDKLNAVGTLIGLAG